MPPSKILQGRCVKPGASFHGRNKFFLVGFSLTFPRFTRISKKRLNTSLSATSSAVCIISSASVVGAPVGISSASFTLIFSQE